MTVPTTLADLSVSEGSNSPLDADSVTATTRPSDYLRAHGAIIRTLAASSTIAAAGTTDLSTVTGTFITLTGAATTITALGTLAAGLYKHVIYNAAHTLTHNGTSLILLGGANRTVAAGDSSLFVSEGSGNWRELGFSDATGYQPLDATLTALAGVLTAANKIPYATALNTAGELDFKDEDNMASDSATALPSQQSVKAYADSLVSSLHPITSGTAIATTSGTAHDFTGIPSWAKRITVMFAGVSTNGTSVPQIQIGDAGGFETTSYVSFARVSDSSSVITSGFGLATGASAAIISGNFVLTKLDGNTWTASATMGRTDDVGFVVLAAGYKTLSDTLTQVRLTTVNGTDAFDAGTVNIIYE